MSTTADYLNQLIDDRNDLADNLVTMGVAASHSETFTSLVPKVLTIPSGSNIGYEVKFKVDGNDYYVASCQQGESITEPPTPTMQSGTFAFWRLNGINVAFPFTPNADCTLEAYAIGATLLAHCDDFTDSGTYQLPLTNNGVDIDTSIKKFGTGSWHFVENTDYVEVPSEHFAFGSNDFTIDFWFYPTAFTGTIINSWTQNGGWSFYVEASSSPAGQFLMAYTTNGLNSTYKNKTISNFFTLNVWQHVAITRNGNNIYIFNNGVLKDTWNVGSDAISTPISPIRIGEHQDPYYSSTHTTGYIDEIRILNGTCAWTSDFTPPTQPY